MKYGLIGEKLSHSFSKEIHESLADYTYDLCEIARDDLSNFLTKRDFCAVNVTIPYKKEVIPFLDFVSDVAYELQAVNVIVNKDGKLYGYNTDYLGMKDQILHTGYDMQDKKVLVLGTGGASRTSFLVAKHLGAKEVLLVSRNKGDNSITYKEAYENHLDADVIINGTPVGMYPNIYETPLDISRFTNLTAVFDAIYNPLNTYLVNNAQNKGLVAEGGLYMLVSQAVHAIEIFIGTKSDNQSIQKVYENTYKSKQNIVLIGMPSSGKTTVGALLAKQLNRELIDIDDELVKRLGCPIAEYFKSHSEKEFRNIETEITKEISKRNGIIIATGGGCILREENVNALRLNGRLYFLDRSLENLTPTNSRPLASKKSDIEALFRARYHIYESVCDAKIDGNLSPDEEANLIIEEFYITK